MGDAPNGHGVEDSLLKTEPQFVVRAPLPVAAEDPVLAGGLLGCSLSPEVI